MEVTTRASVALETYLGRERMAADAQLASATVSTLGDGVEALKEAGSEPRVGASSGGPCRAESEASGPSGESGVYDPSESTSLSGPHTPEGRQQHATQSLTPTPEGTSTGSYLDEAGPSASGRAPSISVPTPPESPALGEQSQLTLGRKLTVLKTLPAVVVLGDDPESPSTSEAGGEVTIQRRISHIVAGHHVHFTKIKRQMGNINAPPEDLLTLMARKVFVRQNCALNQVDSLGQLSDLAAENSMPTPSSGLQHGSASASILGGRGGQAPLPLESAPAMLEATSFSTLVLPRIRTRIPLERRSLSVL